MTVRFGGNVAVNDVSIEVGRDEIVGLIGTNGAQVHTHERHRWLRADRGFGGPSRRARGRPERPHPCRPGPRPHLPGGHLFPELTVRECIQVALESRHRSTFLRSALFLDMATERRKRSDADELIDFLGLGRYAGTFVSDLSTGTRRIVELAGLLAVGADVLCLDEPTAAWPSARPRPSAHSSPRYARRWKRRC
ncbi:MAG: ATP-binding cassette domain-containing protein [Acidimicrobiales bacterium]